MEHISFMEHITLFQIREHIEDGNRIVFLDTRADREWQTADSKIEDAIRLPPGAIQDYAHRLPDDAILVTYCTSPAESLSEEVAEELREMGFKNVYPLQGGFHLWRMADYPLDDVSVQQENNNHA
jgi:rhodanese-related sulfurtransferase